MPLPKNYKNSWHLHLKNFIDKFSEEIYHDYNKINEFLIKKYNIEVPPEIESIVGFEDGETTILNRESNCNFIETIARINFTQIKSLTEYLSDYEITEEKREQTER